MAASEFTLQKRMQQVRIEREASSMRQPYKCGMSVIQPFALTKKIVSFMKKKVRKEKK